MLQKKFIKIGLGICVISLITACASRTMPPVKIQSPSHTASFSIQKMNLATHEAVLATGDNHLLHLKFDGQLKNGELAVQCIHHVEVTDLNGKPVSDYALDRDDYERVVKVLEGV